MRSARGQHGVLLVAELQTLGEDLWIAEGPIVSVAGFNYGTRMAVIRLASGALFIWSPVALTNALKTEIDALGPVRFIVTPTRLHDRFLAEWRGAYSAAKLYAAPGSRERSGQIAFDADQTDAPPSEWAGEIDQVPFKGNAIAVEIVFFHRKSKTALFCDLIQHFEPGWFKGWRAIVAKLDGLTAAQPQVPQKFRVAFNNRKAARASLAQILSWPVERVVMAHAPIVERNGRAFIESAFRWLK